MGYHRGISTILEGQFVINRTSGERFAMSLRLVVPALLLLLPLSFVHASRGAVVIADQAGQEIDLYDQSYALLIGMSQYTAGWDELTSVPKELKAIEKELKRQGFEVEQHPDLDSEKLRIVVRSFINKRGLEKENRLLFFFAGHGWTLERSAGNETGYFVPVDTPDPRSDRTGFLGKAISMDEVILWAKDIESKHALFLFDSCFSGQLFAVRGLPEIPPHISDITKKPVRQFITAGNAKQTVPAKSKFVPAFVYAMRHGAGDLDEDGFVTGTELGMYLRKEVPRVSDQNPQYGKIKHFELSRGDFVFELPQAKTCSLEGEIVAKGQGLEGVSVSVEEASQRRTVATSNSSGRFSATIPRSGSNQLNHLVFFEKDRFVEITQSLEMDAETRCPVGFRRPIVMESAGGETRFANAGTIGRTVFISPYALYGDVVDDDERRLNNIVDKVIGHKIQAYRTSLAMTPLPPEIGVRRLEEHVSMVDRERIRDVGSQKGALGVVTGEGNLLERQVGDEVFALSSEFSVIPHHPAYDERQLKVSDILPRRRTRPSELSRHLNEFWGKKAMIALAVRELAVPPASALQDELLRIRSLLVAVRSTMREDDPLLDEVEHLLSYVNDKLGPDYLRKELAE